MVVEAAEGYPGIPKTGCRINLPADDAHAWTMQACTAELNGHLVGTGGRVLGMVGIGEDLEAARANAYAKLDELDFADGFHRTDIGIPH